jgi:hypothetical protein
MAQRVKAQPSISNGLTLEVSIQCVLLMTQAYLYIFQLLVDSADPDC